MPRKTHRPAKQKRRRPIVKIDARATFKVGDKFTMVPRGCRKPRLFQVIATA